MSRTAADRYVNATRRAELDDLAVAVLEHDEVGSTIDPAMIARHYGLTLSLNDYGDSFDGLLEHRAGRFHIYCNTKRCGNQSEARARFTVAHELGHYFIDEHRRSLERGRPPHPSNTDFGTRNYVEREADWFAGALLMPAARFIKAAKAVRDGLGILRVAETFGASASAAAIRLASLDVKPCAVLCWRGDAVVWRALSPTFFRSRFRYTISDRSELPPDSATAQILRSSRAGEHKENGSTAAAWFRSVPAASDRNLILRESAVSLGQYGALTALFLL